MKRKGLGFKIFIYFLCGSFLLLMNFPAMILEAKELDPPVGEMFSRGAVKLESRENVWKNLENSNFPIFLGMKFKTEKGVAAVTLTNNIQINFGENSLFSFDRTDQILLSKGTIDFRIPSSVKMHISVGSLSVTKFHPLQASKNSLSASLSNQETIGSISVHPDGSMTVKSIQGSLSIENQDHVVLAVLSSKERLTIPSGKVKSPPPVMVAQIGERSAETDSGEFLGISTWGWVGIGAGAVATGVGIGVAAGGGGGGGSRGGPVCP